jgi:hypothetical protein
VERSDTAVSTRVSWCGEVRTRFARRTEGLVASLFGTMATWAATKPRRQTFSTCTAVARTRGGNKVASFEQKSSHADLSQLLSIGSLPGDLDRNSE